MNEIEIPPEGDDLYIAIVVGRFNEYAGRGELEACLDELKKLGVPEDNITVMRVPGALEIPMALSMIARSSPYVDAMIALGAVIRGETYHFEIVSNESARGIMDLQLKTGIPIANGILTCETDEQAVERLEIKGRDCARCAVEMANYSLAFQALREEQEGDDDDDDDDDEER
ncbi:MAG TPA: 6,7-dimethyl-8-ribityllumazine synthase [Candidatus Sutterella merdavium]|jgi:6,7-dimethyl-8-ribityllumazine synthase|nr:6,7-dimethyl-8-ribityllumazine synthase [Candidatus Sutterella merdavium]